MHYSQSHGLAAALLLALTVPAVAAEKLSDAQIAHIAYTAGDLDIKAAESRRGAPA